MHTMQHKQSGLPDTSFLEETPLLGHFLHEDDQQAMIEEAETIRKRYTNVNVGKLGPIIFSEKGNRTEIVLLKNAAENRISFKKAGSDGERNLLKSFTDKFSAALGPRAEDIIAEDRDTI